MLGGGDIKLLLSLAFTLQIKIIPLLALSTLSFVIINKIRNIKNKNKDKGYAFAPYISAFAIPLLLI